MSPRLWIRESPGHLREQLLEGGHDDEGIVVGRDAAADIVLSDGAVSRFHARFCLREDGWHVVDLGSSNRTFVNGDPVRESLLAPGDHIGIGDCELQFVDEIDRVTQPDARKGSLGKLKTWRLLSRASDYWSTNSMQIGVRCYFSMGISCSAVQPARAGIKCCVDLSSVRRSTKN